MSDPAMSGSSDDFQIGSLQSSTPQSKPPEPPIQRLHPELFSEVFWYCLDNYIYDYPFGGGGRRLPHPSVMEPPLILCRICRRWRQLVLANPLLWAQIELEGSNPSSHLVALDEWLVRSQRSQLHLSVNYNACDTPEFEEKINNVIAKFVPHSWRWKYAFFRIPSICADPIVRKLGEGSDSLQNLMICDSFSYQEGETLAVDLSRQKILSELRMDGIHFIPNHNSITNVRILHMSFLTIDEYLHCLDVCPAASDIEFSGDFHFQPSVYQAIRILHSVTTLTLRFRGLDDEPQSLGKFLALLQVPNVKKLRLFLSEAPEEWKHASDLIKRSSPPLTSFTAYGPMADNYFFQCLRHMTHLQILKTKFSTFDNEKLSTLIERPRPGKPYACPELREIHLDSSCSSHVLLDVAALVLHRWYSSEMESDSPSRISTVTLRAVNHKRGRPFLNYPGMRQCIKDGLQGRFLGRYYQSVNPDSESSN